MRANPAATPSVGPLLPAHPDWLSRSERSSNKRRAVVLAVACAHVLLFWALLHANLRHPALREMPPLMPPLMVTLLARPMLSEAPAPQTETSKPTLAARPTLPHLTEPSLAQVQPTLSPLQVDGQTPAQAEPRAVEPRESATAHRVSPADAAPVLNKAPTTQPAAPAAPARKLLAATAVRYLVEPPVEVPRAARRAGEHGVVVLRVVVDVLGVPVNVTVQRSSGYSRLDEQAVWAMRQARFQPHTEDGRAVEVEVLAPIDYPQE